MDGSEGMVGDGGELTSRFATDDGAADTEEGGGTKGGNSERLQIDRNSFETEQFVQLKLCTRTSKEKVKVRKRQLSSESIQTPVFKVRFNSFCETTLD